jgi:formylglycine-generating enzyme required for sulfatase activity
VVCVTLDDATAYAAWLNSATGQRGWRLPTEAEWEKAARWDAQGQHSRIYPWGDRFDVNRCKSEQSSLVTVHGKGPRAPVSVTINTTTIIGSYPASDKSRSGASPYGVEEMAGNVWEWTSSGFKPYPYTPSDGHEDRKSGDDITLRGGSWYVGPANVRAARRKDFSPSGLSADIGFRVVCASPDP